MGLFNARYSQANTNNSPEEFDALDGLKCLKKITKIVLWAIIIYYPVNILWSISAGSGFTFQFANFIDVIDTFINWNSNSIANTIFPFKHRCDNEVLSSEYILAIFLPLVNLAVNSVRCGFAVIMILPACLSYFRALKGRNSGFFEGQ